jgi:hypothetical protein
VKTIIKTSLIPERRHGLRKLFFGNAKIADSPEIESDTFAILCDSSLRSTSLQLFTNFFQDGIFLCGLAK